jgi:superfamily II DNA or RNA helicase
MTRLEDITAGVSVSGIAPEGTVEVVSVEWYGDEAIQVIYRDGGGAVKNRLLYRDEESSLSVVASGGAWSFDGDGAMLRLVSEAMRIRLGYLFDPYLAIHTSRIEALPHQITAVYGEMLRRQPLRFLLADDPGAGKTIMTGLLIKELAIRGDLERCLIVAPGNLVEQWQDELSTKFGLSFAILSRDQLETSGTGNPFEDQPLLIARLDMLSRNEELQARLAASQDHDLIVVDEAHKMSASYTGGEVKYTKRYHLGEALGEHARHFLLLTATPHNGKQDDFELFMALLDGDRFEGRPRASANGTDAGDLMRRLVKEELLRFDGKPLFPERRAYTVRYALSEGEAALYDEVTDYVRDEMNRAERFAAEDDRRRVNVGFALQILQRRLASSPEAIYRSLQRRRERLEKRLAEESLAQTEETAAISVGGALPRLTPEFFEDLEDAPETEVEEVEGRVLSQATAAATVAELRTEISTLERLEERARVVRYSGVDTKWLELNAILDDPLMVDEDGNRRKLIVFTEAKDTLNYLADRIRTRLGKPEAVVVIHGGIRREERKRAVEAFTQDKDTLIMVANDAAGEGINLQRAHLMVNYDLPWNPNRLEQRFGRIHRIGQREVCHLWNLIASETREGDVYSRLLEKLEQERKDLGGRVYDVLGRLFEARPLRDLLVEAIRYGNRPEVKAKLDQAVESAVDRRRLEELLEERALARETMDASRVEEIREHMERAEARRLQPHFVRSFFLEAFEHLGGKVRRREPGRWEVTHVPYALRERASAMGARTSLPRRYERIAFEKEHLDQQPTAAFVCPGHLLLDATLDLVLERHRDLLKRGAVLVDEEDAGDDARTLFYLEHSVQDGIEEREGEQRVISKRLQFVEIDADGDIASPGPAPYLDYRPLEEGERQLLSELLESSRLGEGEESDIVGYAVRDLVPRHVAEIRRHRMPLIDKVERQVEARLKAQINYWDHRAAVLKDQEKAGKKTRLSWTNAAAHAEDLAGRLKRRRETLERERQISALPPVVKGGALIVPGGFLRRLKGEDSGDGTSEEARKEVELIAMRAVEQAERVLGRIPRDVSATRGIGHDIESKDPITGSLYFIEVKGRRGSDVDVTLTKNEILCSRNEPETFRLALVVVGENGLKPPRYLVGHPFGEPDFAETSRSFSLRRLLEKAGEPA